MYQFNIQIIDRFAYTYGWDKEITAVNSDVTYTMVCTPTPTQLQTITVCDGTAVYKYAPYPLFNNIYSYVHSQQIYPAEMLSALSKGDIWSLTFYSDNDGNVSTQVNGMKVYLTEVEEKFFEDGFMSLDNAVEVFDGNYTFTGSENTITFTQPYTYNGGNLLIAITNSEGGNYSTESFHGEWQDGYTNYSVWNRGGWYSDFLAKCSLGYYEAEKVVNVHFMDINGNLKQNLEIHAINYAFSGEGIAEQISANIPSAPYLDGYTFAGWTLNGTTYDREDLTLLLTLLVADVPEEAIIVNETYTQADTLYSVTVTGGTVNNFDGDTSGSYKASEQIYVKATGGTEEQQFSYWTKQDIGSTNPVVVSYEKTYAFRMPSKDTALTAVYEGECVKTGTAYIENVTKTGDAAISFVAILSVPSDATILRAGIVACKESDLNETHTYPTIDFARFKRYDEMPNYMSYKYTWTKSNINPMDTWCVCAYLLYSDQDGEHTIYSNMVKANLNDFNT